MIKIYCADILNNLIKLINLKQINSLIKKRSPKIQIIRDWKKVNGRKRIKEVAKMRNWTA